MRYALTTSLILGILALTGGASNTWAEPTEKQLRQLSVNCLQCHADPRTGAPLMGLPKDWQPVVEKGLQQVTRNVIQGINGMPPMGYCSSCSQQDLEALIKLVSGVQEWRQ